MNKNSPHLLFILHPSSFILYLSLVTGYCFMLYFSSSDIHHSSYKTG
jgi:hypothetical protein